jgi:SAM-dependent methyltransferase
VSESSRRRRDSFDRVAVDYNRYRSGYPPAVIDDVTAVSGISRGSRVLEIGCGTGQLSVPLARCGAELTAVELGPHLAALARSNLAAFPTARVDIAAFEDWPLPAAPFDAVVSASAFHWLDPDVALAKSARALRPGGRLTLVHVHHVRGGTPGFFEDTQPFYQRWGLSDDPFFQPATVAGTPLMYPELDERPEFGPVQRHRFEIPRRHTAESYVGWLRTDSLVSSLAGEARQGFLGDIGRLIETKYGGAVSRNFLHEVITAAKAS